MGTIRLLFVVLGSVISLGGLILVSLMPKLPVVTPEVGFPIGFQAIMAGCLIIIAANSFTRPR